MKSDRLKSVHGLSIEPYSQASCRSITGDSLHQPSASSTGLTALGQSLFGRIRGDKQPSTLIRRVGCRCRRTIRRKSPTASDGFPRRAKALRISCPTIKSGKPKASAAATRLITFVAVPEQPGRVSTPGPFLPKQWRRSRCVATSADLPRAKLARHALFPRSEVGFRVINFLPPGALPAYRPRHHGDGGLRIRTRVSGRLAQR